VGDKKILLVHETNIQAKDVAVAIVRYLTELGNHRVSIEITTEEQPIPDPICRCSSPMVLHEAPNVCQRCGKLSRLPPIQETRVGGVGIRRLEAHVSGCSVALEGPAEARADDDRLRLHCFSGAPIFYETWRAIVPAVDALFEAWRR
jgi:hypothetical protein